MLYNNILFEGRCALLFPLFLLQFLLLEAVCESNVLSELSETKVFIFWHVITYTTSRCELALGQNIVSFLKQKPYIRNKGNILCRFMFTLGVIIRLFVPPIWVLL